MRFIYTVAKVCQNPGTMKVPISSGYIVPISKGHRWSIVNAVRMNIFVPIHC